MELEDKSTLVCGWDPPSILMNTGGAERLEQLSKRWGIPDLAWSGVEGINGKRVVFKGLEFFMFLEQQGEQVGGQLGSLIYPW